MKALRSIRLKKLSCCLCFLILISFSCRGTPPRKSGDPIFYVRGNQLVFVSLKDTGPKPMVLTSDFLNTPSVSPLVQAVAAERGASLIRLQPSMNLLIYPQQFDPLSQSSNLYFLRASGNPFSKPRKIADSVSEYQMKENSDRLFFLDSEKQLFEYIFAQESKRKLSESGVSVSSFHLSEDGRRLLYLDENRSLFLCEDGRSEKIAEDVSDFFNFGGFDDPFYYLQEPNLCRVSKGRAVEKIDSEVSEVLKIYTGGEIYYLKSKPCIDIPNYIEDDTADSDREIPYAQLSSRLSGEDPPPPEEFEKRQEAVRKYEDRKIRELLREGLDRGILPPEQHPLYFYDGGRSTLLLEHITEDSRRNFLCSGETPAAIVQAAKFPAQKTPLSSFRNLSGLEELLSDILNAHTACYLLSAGKVLPLEEKTRSSQIPSFPTCLSPDGKSALYVREIDSRGRGQLCLVTAGDPPGQEVIDEGVFFRLSRIAGENQILYTKNKYDLYQNRKKLSEHAFAFPLDPNGRFLMLEGPSLFLFENETLSKITDLWQENLDIQLSREGHILYIRRSSPEAPSGDLYLHLSQGEDILIDREVHFLIGDYFSRSMHSPLR